MNLATNWLQITVFSRLETVQHSTPNAFRKINSRNRFQAKRRARDSNPQPVSRHDISSVAASHSLTLRFSPAGGQCQSPHPPEIGRQNNLS